MIKKEGQLKFKTREICKKNGHFIVSFVLILPFLYYLFGIRAYIPGFDEACQIEAAIRLSDGYGNTYSLIENEDISMPNFSFQNAWPIGYSSSLAFLLFMGLPLAYTLKLFKLSIIIATIFAWLKLSEFFIKDIWLKILFSCVISGYVIKYAQSVTDMIVVLFISIFSILLLSRTWKDKSDQSYWYKRTRDPLAIGLLIATMILFKYSGMFLIASCSFWIIFMHNGLKKKSILSFLKFSIPVVLIIGFTIVNKLNSPTSLYAINTSKFVLNIPFFYQGWADDIFNAIFQSTYLEKIIIAIIPSVAGKFSYIIVFVKVVFVIVFFTTLLLLFRKGGKIREISIWIIVNYLALIIFLKVVSGLYFEDVLHWLPLKEGRFYWPLLPFLPLGILIVLESKWNFLSTMSKATVTAGTTIALLAGICFYAHYNYNKYKSLNYEMPLLESALLKVIKSDTNVIVFCDQINWQLYPYKGKYNVLDQPPKFSTNQYFSKKTTVIMLYNSNNYLSAGNDVELGSTKIFRGIANTWGFNEVKVGKFTTMFWREFPAGFSFK